VTIYVKETLKALNAACKGCKSGNMNKNYRLTWVIKTTRFYNVLVFPFLKQFLFLSYVVLVWTPVRFLSVVTFIR